MKILHITGLNVGGAEIVLKRLIESHHDNPDCCHSVISLTETGKIGQQLQVLGIEVHALGMEGGGMYTFFSGCPSWYLTACSTDPKGISRYSSNLDVPRRSVGGRVAARIAGNRHVIWGIHNTGVDPGCRATVAVRRLCAWLSHCLPHTIVCVSEAVRKANVALGYDATRMEVVPNGFDMSWLVPKEQCQHLRVQLGYQQKNLVIGIVGRFDYIKDHENFVKAAGILARKHPHLRFLMVGRDLDAGNSALVSWISETGHADRFALLGERDDVPVCLSAMDIFCLSSRIEGFPLVLGEAMVMRLPCVTTDVADVRYMLGDTGIVVAKEDATALAAGLEKLLVLTPDERVLLGQQNRQRIHDKFTMSHTRKRFEAIYNKILSRNVC